MNGAEFLKVLALGYSWSLCTLFLLIFNAAYLNGGEVTILINKYGEMYPELFFLNLVMLPVITVGLYYLTVDGIRTDSE